MLRRRSADPREANLLSRLALTRALKELAAMGADDLVTAIGRLVEGERDLDTLCEILDLHTAVIVEIMIQGIADPSTLADLTRTA